MTGLREEQEADHPACQGQIRTAMRQTASASVASVFSHLPGGGLDQTASGSAGELTALLSATLFSQRIGRSLDQVIHGESP